MQVRSGDLDLADPRFRDDALLYALFVARSQNPPLYEQLFTHPVAHKLANWAGESLILRSRNQVLAESIAALLDDQTSGTVIVPWGAEHFEFANGSLLDTAGLRRVDFERKSSEKLPVLKCVSDPQEHGLARLQRGMLCNQHRSEEEKKAAQAARSARQEAERTHGTSRKNIISNPSRFGEPQITIEDGRILVGLEYTEGHDLKDREFFSCELKAAFFSPPDADGGSRIQDRSLNFVVAPNRTEVKKSFRRPPGASELALSLRCAPHPEERDLGRHVLTPVAEPPAPTTR